MLVLTTKFNHYICLMQVGNALTDDYHDHLGVAQFMWSSGLISDQTYNLLNQCDSDSFIHPSNSCEKVFENADVELGNIDPYSIFTSLCPGNVSQSKQLLRRKHVSVPFLYYRLNRYS